MYFQSNKTLLKLVEVKFIAKLIEFDTKNRIICISTRRNKDFYHRKVISYFFALKSPKD